MKNKVYLYMIALMLFTLLLSMPVQAISTDYYVNVYGATYDYIYSLNGEYYTVYDDRHYAIVDSANAQHYTTNSDGMGAFSEGFVSVYDSEIHRITFTTLDGYSFDVESVRGCGEFSGGKCSVTSVDGKYGLIDTTGHYLLECEYEDIIYDSSDTFLVCKENVWQLARLNNGEVTLEALVKSNVVNPINESLSQNIIASDGEHYGIISTDNKVLVEFNYEYIYDLTNGLYAGINGKTTDLIMADGKVTASIEATVLGSYSEGKIPCYMNEKFCYINKDGKVVNEVAVSDTNSIGSYYEGWAVIQMEDGSYSYLAENGELATRYVWDYAARFARGYALVMDVVASDTVDGEYVRSWKIIDHNFNTVEQLNVEVYVNDAEEHTTDFSNGFIRTVDNETGKMGFAYTANTYALYDCQSDGHINGNWIIDKEAEIGIAGEKHISCIKCGEVMETTIISPLPGGSGKETDPNTPTNPDKPEETTGKPAETEISGTMTEKPTEPVSPETTTGKSEESVVPDTTTNNPQAPSDNTNSNNPSTNKGSEKSNRWFIFAGITLLILILVIVWAAIRHKRRYFC